MRTPHKMFTIRAQKKTTSITVSMKDESRICFKMLNFATLMTPLTLNCEFHKSEIAWHPVWTGGTIDWSKVQPPVSFCCQVGQAPQQETWQYWSCSASFITYLLGVRQYGFKKPTARTTVRTGWKIHDFKFYKHRKMTGLEAKSFWSQTS